MAECFLYGNSGVSGSGLKIINGLTAISNPSENTMWVKTETPIRNVVISKTEPESPSVGELWLSISVGCLANDCKIYTASGWDTVDAYVYTNGEWVQFMYSKLFLYNKGDLCEAVTGGFEPYAYSNSYASGLKYGNPTVANGDTSCKISMQGLGANYVRHGSVFIANTVDVSSFETLTLHFASLPNFGTWTLGLTDEKTQHYIFDASVEFTKSSVTDNTIALDVSELSGEYYIVIKISVAYSSNTGSIELDQLYLSSDLKSGGQIANPSEPMVVTTSGDTIIMETDMSVRTDGDAIIIGGG